MNKHNITTRRYPRTMNEAFGPYTHEQFDEPKLCRQCDLWAVMAIATIMFIAAYGLLLYFTS